MLDYLTLTPTFIRKWVIQGNKGVILSPSEVEWYHSPDVLLCHSRGHVQLVIGSLISEVLIKGEHTWRRKQIRFHTKLTQVTMGGGGRIVRTWSIEGLLT